MTVIYILVMEAYVLGNCPREYSPHGIFPVRAVAPIALIVPALILTD